MKNATLLIAFIAAFATSANAYAPQAKTNTTPKPLAFDLKKAAAATFTAATIASSTLIPLADAVDFKPMDFGSTNVVAEKVVREGLYRDYEVDLPDKASVDDARSNFKSAGETKSKKGKYTALLSVLIVGSFIIPMAQYFWYVKDDDSSDKFFADQVPEPKAPPKKKGGMFGRK